VYLFVFHAYINEVKEKIKRIKKEKENRKKKEKRKK
jgi:hypothetical protein